MPKGSEEKRARGLFGPGAKSPIGKRETVRERRIAKAKAKKPFDIRVRQSVAIDAPEVKLKARETGRSIKRNLDAAMQEVERALTRKK